MSLPLQSGRKFVVWWTWDVCSHGLSGGSIVISDQGLRGVDCGWYSQQQPLDTAPSQTEEPLLVSRLSLMSSVNFLKALRLCVFEQTRRPFTVAFGLQSARTNLSIQTRSLKVFQFYYLSWIPAVVTLYCECRALTWQHVFVDPLSYSVDFDKVKSIWSIGRLILFCTPTPSHTYNFSIQLYRSCLTCLSNVKLRPYIRPKIFDPQKIAHPWWATVLPNPLGSSVGIRNIWEHG